jgi:hypothetical protein
MDSGARDGTRHDTFIHVPVATSSKSTSPLFSRASRLGSCCPSESTTQTTSRRSGHLACEITMPPSPVGSGPLIGEGGTIPRPSLTTKGIAIMNDITMSQEQAKEILKAVNGIGELLNRLPSKPEDAPVKYAIMSNLSVIQMTLTGRPRASSN